MKLCSRDIVYEVLEVYEAISSGYASWRSRAWKLAEVLKGGVVLDLGSGHCINGLHLSIKRNAYYLVCLDIAPSMLQEAKRTALRSGYLRVDFLAADATSIPLRHSSVDSLISIALVHHLPGEELRKFFREVSRTLKPGGQLLVTSWSRRQLRFVLHTFLNLFKTLLRPRTLPEYRVKWRTRKGVYVRRYYFYEANDLKRFAEGTGLRILTYGYVARGRNLNSFIVAMKST